MVTKILVDADLLTVAISALKKIDEFEAGSESCRQAVLPNAAAGSAPGLPV
jgi:hypothetical protein